MTNKELNCLVIGSNGWLGYSITGAMKNAGIKHVKLSHQKTGPKHSLFEIARPMIEESNYFSHAIYLSWSTNRTLDFQEKSYLAARYAADWAARNNVRIIFISSMSAGVETPRSNYGHFKKLAEQHYLNLGFEVVRPGTVIADKEFVGSALAQLQNVSRLEKFVLTLLKPVSLPVIHINVFVETLIKTIMGVPSLEPQNLIQKTTTLQSMLDLRSGWIPFSWIQILLPLLSISSRDKLQTLIDLN